MKNSLKIASVFIGTFVGAGFASGQEIMQYFVVYGKWGIAGAVVAGLLFGLFCYTTLYNVLNMGADAYVAETNRNGILKFIYYAFMIMIFCTMVTASGEMLKETAGLPKIWGVLGMVFLCAFVMYFGCDGVVKLNALLTPIIIVGVLAICGVNILTNTVGTMAGVDVAGSSVIYVSYNVITLASVSAGLGKLVKNKKTVMLASLLSGGGVLVLILCMFYILYGMSVTSEIPVLEALSKWYMWIYVPVLVSAMVTTAVGNGYGIVANSKWKMGSILLLSIIAFAFSFFRFSFVVKYIYAIFGYVGIYAMLDNLKIYVKLRKKKKKRIK